MERHADHFRPDTSDEEWLREIGAKRWIALTHDGRIRYKPNELATVMQHGVALLVIVGHAPYPDLARSFLATKGRILDFLERHETPYIAKVYRPAPGDVAKDPSTPGRSLRPHVERRSRRLERLPEPPDHHIPPLLDLRIHEIGPPLEHFPALREVLGLVVDAADALLLAGRLRTCCYFPMQKLGSLANKLIG